MSNINQKKEQEKHTPEGIGVGGSKTSVFFRVNIIIQNCKDRWNSVDQLMGDFYKYWPEKLVSDFYRQLP